MDPIPCFGWDPAHPPAAEIPQAHLLSSLSIPKPHGTPGASPRAQGPCQRIPCSSLSSRLLLKLYELDEDPKRKEFLDDLFSFMQKRGTPVNRIPIMAKQVLDLYTLYRLVTDKGGLVEVINKKIWREITKGLNLPTSITSAAFTLRTQYMKYLYPYECEKRALSSPGELQAAIDSNRREGRRQTFGAALFNYSPAGTPTLLGSPKMPLPALSISTHGCALPVVAEDGAVPAVPGRIAIPVGLAGHHLALREKLETGEPPEKKVALTAEEQQRLMQQALQHNLLAVASQFPMNIKVSNRGRALQPPARPPWRLWGGTQLPGEDGAPLLRQVASVSFDAHIGISFPQMTDRRPH
uniref:AT-rich interactive domain-containing protein 3 n=1 Tax=Anser brachyrhynchus TaxID=132585 RepID=A0A8B9CVE6_9AVES